MPKDTSPTMGLAKTSRDGRKAIRISATAAIEPRSPALGTSLLIDGPIHAPIIFTTPITTITAIAIFHDSIASFVARNAGPITPNVKPKVEGVSSPKGIAVTSSLPVFFASLIAIRV